MDWNFLIKNKDSLTVSTDTRNLPAGCVFFALRGDSFDGNQFADQALDKGAAMAVVSDETIYNQLVANYGKERACLPPPSLRGAGGVHALQSLALAWRRELDIPVIGITGTNGKTTTKELTAAVLATKYHIHYTQGNLNNSIGVPLTLLQLTRQHQLAIVEMGASHPGDIAELVGVAEPNYGVITNVGRAHLQGYGTFEGVQRTKRELYDYLLTHNGFIFRNADNPYLSQMYDEAKCAVTGHSPNRGEPERGLYHTGVMPSGTHIVGNYNAENISAALCIGEYFGVSKEQGLAAIRAYIPSNNRSQLIHSPQGNTIVVDAYNANPSSMQAAINAFDGDTYILGAMRELGTCSHLEHQNVVNMLAERKAQEVYLVGEEYKDTTSPYPVFVSVEDLHVWLSEHKLYGKMILLKGSHSTHMERLLDIL